MVRFVRSLVTGLASSGRDEVVGHSAGGTCKSKHTHKALRVLICRVRLVSCRGLVSVSALTVMGVNAIGEFRRLKIEMLIVAEKGLCPGGSVAE